MELQLKELFCGKNFNTDAENWCWYCTCCNFHSCWNLTSAFIDLTSGSGLFIRSWFGFKGLFGWFCLTDLATLSVLTCKCDGTVTAHSFILHEGYFSILSPLNLKKKRKKKKREDCKNFAWSSEPTPVTYPKVGGCESGWSRDVGGGGRVGVEGIDVGQQRAHHRWHPWQHVLRGQTREMAAEEKEGRRERGRDGGMDAAVSRLGNKMAS